MVIVIECVESYGMSLQYIWLSECRGSSKWSGHKSVMGGMTDRLTDDVHSYKPPSAWRRGITNLTLKEKPPFLLIFCISLAHRPPFRNVHIFTFVLTCTWRLIVELNMVKKVLLIYYPKTC